MTSQIENDLVALFEAQVRSLHLDAPPAVNNMAVGPKRHRSSRLAATIAAAGLLVVGGAGVWWAVHSRAGTTPANQPNVPVEQPTWRQLPDAPLSGRIEATVVGVGDEVIVFGGSDFLCPPNADCVIGDAVAFADGAAFNRATGRWRTIADLPSPTVRAETAVLGDVVYALTHDLGGDHRELVAYDVGDDTWVVIDLPSDPANLAMSIVAVDRGIVLYPTTDEFGAEPDWRLSTEDGTWTELPADPLGPGFDRAMVWNGDALFLFDKALVDSPGGADGPAYTRAARLDDGEWFTIDASDSIGPAPTLIDGDRLIAPALGCADGGDVNGYGRCIPFGAVLDTTANAWNPLPDGPDPSDRGMTFGGWSDTNLVGGSANGGPFFDATTDTWITQPALEPAPAPDSDEITNRVATSIGDALVVFGGDTWGPDGGRLLADAHMWSPKQP